MKKIILTLAFAVAAVAAMAQTTDTKSDKKDDFDRLNVGIHAGVTAAQISFPDVALTTSGKAGFYGGAELQYNVEKWLGIRLGCDYSLNRAYVPNPADVFGSRLNYQQSSVAVPLTLQIGYFDKEESVSVGFGGYASYNFNKTGALMPAADNKGFGGGLQCSVDFGYGHFFYQLQLRYDLSEIGFQTPGVSGPYPSANLFSVMLGIGYRF